MTCAWFRDNVHAYALGALDAGDRILMERHLSEQAVHDGCLEALAEAMDTVAALDAGIAPMRPSDAVWSAIERETDPRDVARDVEPRVVTRDTGASRIDAPPVSRLRLREAVGWGLAVAASAALFAAYSVTTEMSEVVDGSRRELRRLEAARGEHERDIQKLALAQTERDVCKAALTAVRDSSQRQHMLVAMLDKPETRIVRFAPQGGAEARATAIVDATEKRAFVVSAALPELSGKDYQLWVIAGSNAPKPAGFVRFTSDGTAIGEFDRTLLAGGMPDAVAVSVEPAGGGTSPTDVILVAKLAG